MNGADVPQRRTRVQAISLALLLTGSAFEIWAVAGGQDAVRDGLLALIALTMMVAAIWG